MPICNALMTKAYNLKTCKAITCIKAITVSGFMLLFSYLKRQTASKWQITRSIIIWLNQITNTSYINKPSFSQLYFEIVSIKRFSTLFCHTLSLFLFV